MSGGGGETGRVPRSRRSRRQHVAVVAVILGAALLLVTLGCLAFAGGLGGVRALGAPERPLPLDTTVTLEPGAYVVYERTGTYGDAGGVVNFSANNAPRVLARDVSVVGADGAVVGVRGRIPGATSTIKRDGIIYTDAARFHVPRRQGYRVVVVGAYGGVVLAPAFAWQAVPLRVAAVSGVTGVVLLVGGLLVMSREGRRARVGQPPFGWYPDPHLSGRWRYWDGRGWTDHVR